MSVKSALDVGLPQSGTSGSGTAQNGTPHRRYHFSPAQTLELNQAFSLNPYPSVKDRQELATRLGIDQKVLIVEFKLNMKLSFIQNPLYAFDIRFYP